MIYPIVKYGQPVLEKPAEPVAVFDGELEKLVADMFETMYAAHGVGLAAPQIGISKRLCAGSFTKRAVSACPCSVPRRLVPYGLR